MHLHHIDVKSGLKQSAVYIWKDDVVDEDFGISFGHSSGRLLQYLYRWIIRPVVENVRKVVCTCT